jgi:hypothetical protein
MYFQHLLARQIKLFNSSAYRSYFHKMAMSDQPKGIKCIYNRNINPYLVDGALSKRCTYLSEFYTHSTNINIPINAKSTTKKKKGNISFNYDKVTSVQSMKRTF